MTIAIIENSFSEFVMIHTQALCIMSEDEDQPMIHVAERMANMIAEQIQKKGYCRIYDLKALGFSLNDITRYWPQACKLAETKKPRTLQ